MSSITNAEHDRAKESYGLQDKVVACQRTLENVQAGVGSLSANPLEKECQLERQVETIGTLDCKVDQTIPKLRHERRLMTLIQEVKLMALTTEDRIRSVPILRRCFAVLNAVRKD
jgi:hypothetical protein